MKKTLIILGLLASAGAAYSQIQNTFGAHLSYGTEDLNLGFGARGEFGVTDKISISPKFTYHTGKSETIGSAKVSATAWSLDADGHYYFSADKTAFYGIAGLSYNSASVKTTGPGLDVSGSDSEIGLNLGAGVNFSAGNLLPFAEAKYNTAFEAILLQAGLKFPIGGK